MILTRTLKRMTPENPVRGWRVGPPISGVAGTLYDFVRHFLSNCGGSACRISVEEALLSDPLMRQKLERSRGFQSLINNMRHSGDITVEGENVRMTARSVRRINSYADRSARQP